MVGRGLLGRWGPNHAADPIVTRWKKDRNGGKVLVKGKPCLEFVAIKRRDTGEWALPGVSTTLIHRIRRGVLHTLPRGWWNQETLFLLLSRKSLERKL